MAPGSRWATCRLCLAEANLCDSHIVPEWCYEQTYDAKHRAQVLRIETPKHGLIQKGWRERLLCSTCETLISRWEGRFKQLWRHGPSALPPRFSGPRFQEHQVTGADYSTFKLFHLSILWRASVAVREEFAAVSLGRHEDQIRKMLLSEDAGPESAYPICGLVLTRSDGVVEHSLVSMPQHAEYPPAAAVVYTAYAGCEWTVFVAGHLREFPAEVRTWASLGSIRANGTARIAVIPLECSNTVRLWREQRRAADGGRGCP